MKRTRLFMLHFAGGNQYSFRNFSPLVSNFDLISLELPGRGKRSGEKLLNNFDQASQDLYNQIKNKIDDSPFFIFGHSMGALLAFKIAQMLENSQKMPAHVIVSGNPGPGIVENRKRYLLDRDKFITEIKLLGGLPEEILLNREVLDFYLPILRADFQISENNGLDNTYAIQAPIFAMMGSAEEYSSEITNWKHFTRGAFNQQIFDGDHFFIYKNDERIISVINTLLVK